MGEETWRKYLTDYNEGLGVVYERFVLNDLLKQIEARNSIKNILEVPLYGMAGVSGINSVPFAQQGKLVTLIDQNAERLRGVEKIWKELNLPVETQFIPTLNSLPFPDRSFDLVWNFAALWQVKEADPLLAEMARVTRKVLLICVPNRVQIGYWLRKHVWDKEFFSQADERWTDIRLIKSKLKKIGIRIAGEGVLDIPPWPDTCMPAGELLAKFGIKSKKYAPDTWKWSMMDFYLGKDPGLREKVTRYMFLERLKVPWRVKAIWAHHHYLIGEKND